MEGKFEIVKDEIADRLDELADLAEHWKRNREKGRESCAIRIALLMLCSEIKALESLEHLEKQQNEVLNYENRHNLQP